MGTYLSTPVTEKCQESGESLDCPVVPVCWGVVDMQGWRKSMEDAHVAQTDIPVPPHHVEHQQADQNSTAAIASADAKVFGVFDGHGGPEVARFCQLYLVSVLTQQSAWTEESPTSSTETNPALKGVGEALVSAFHALDRMLNDPSRRDEIINLRTLKPQPGERREAVSIPPPPPLDSTAPPEQGGFPALGASSSTDGESPTGSPAVTEFSETPRTDESSNDNQDEVTPDSQPQQTSEEESEATRRAEGKEEQEEREGSPPDEPAPGNNDDDSDDDSDAVVGKKEAAELDRDMMDDADDEKDSVEHIQGGDAQEAINSSKVSAMFQKILSLGTNQSGQVVIKVGDANDAAKAGVAAQPAPALGPSVTQPSVVHNGRMTCNLPDHPIHAGATAIVAVLVGRLLTVANAGDSRAVLCRGGGKTVPLSYDHKPQQEREMTRINRAGGFVNHFGRVNGNLNLSRSIGDLKYKQVAGIPPPGQIITAEPDIMQLTLDPNDEFLILGCDGIWDCLTNEKAVDFVRERINRMTPTEIGVEMLDTIISDDPRATQGIGGDNMTVMVVDLQPQSRNRALPAAAEEAAHIPPTTPE